MKKILLTAAVATILAAPMAAQAEKIGVTMFDYNDTFRSLLREGVDAAARKAGASVQFEDAKQDVGIQLNQIQNFISQKVDAIIVQAVDTDATPKITQLAAKARIPLIYINARPSDFDKLPAGVAVVASDEVFGGTLQAQAVCKQLGGKGQALVLMGNLIHEAARLRTQAVENSFKSDKACAGIKLVDKREGKWSRTEAQDITTNWLTAGVKFDAIIANNDEMALGAINALKAAKKLDGKVVVAGIDATRDAMASMKAGELKVTVFQNAAAQGAGSVDAALKLVKGQKVDKFVNIPFELVTPENLAQYASKN
ncbi:sugar ABC transporter substrate-binding protein [Malikia granosa]|uniref:Rhizopine-binding protein n=1 Tax=Malikia granosa TaxID=263067 RepID=A0A2S9K131_9BURK|nr:sugar ABC transporter substrate-binding protein [Malikia granosa]PRD64125.1 rhizopine-binding protein [Malikia granosa]